MNNDNRANDANDNGDELYVDFPETERQELLRRRLEFGRERQLLLQEQAELLLEQQQQQLLLEQARLLREQHHLFQDDVNARMVRVTRRQQPPQRQAFEMHVLAWQQQQQAESVEEDTEEDADTFSLSMVVPNLNSTVMANNNKRSESVCVM